MSIRKSYWLYTNDPYDNRNAKKPSRPTALRKASKSRGRSAVIASRSALVSQQSTHSLKR